MDVDDLVNIVHSADTNSWKARNEAALRALFGSPNGRYQARAQETVNLRAPEMRDESGVPFAAYIHPSNPSGGAYGGMSFVLFPVPDAPCLLGMVVGTQGLAPDEAILGRPGHARKMQAITAWLNRTFGNGEMVAWSKQDPTRTDIAFPDPLRTAWSEYSKVFHRYGNVLYAVYRPTDNRDGTTAAVKAFLDVMFEERGQKPIARSTADVEQIQAKWFQHLMNSPSQADVVGLLEDRRFVIVQGPPGTGKTRMASRILRDDYAGRGEAIQFHANTTYEGFIGGLAPVAHPGDLGFRFAPFPGALMRAAAEARKIKPEKYLLHIDEINRADLSKVLGEAISLIESRTEIPRSVSLPFDFGQPWERTLSLPDNLHILGTMNSSDRSIAIVDIAVRRRFAFLSLWPDSSVVEQHGCEITRNAFRDLLSIFIEHAGEDVLSLIPGHSYFMESDDALARRFLQTNLAPLLREYLTQGYVAAFAEPIRTYLQSLEGR